MPRRRSTNEFYSLLRQPTPFDPGEVRRLFQAVDRERVERLAGAVAEYIGVNLMTTIERRSGLPDYRTSPYVLLACASVMGLTDPEKLGRFLVDTKLYMGLETSFGKQIESAFVGHYPIRHAEGENWHDPPEKVAEAQALEGLSQEEKAAQRRESVWREVDKSCVVGSRRYLATIKSGPNTINDTQVDAMQAAIRRNYATWLRETRDRYDAVTSLDIVIGLTYGTNATTNNKENQILVKLRGDGFEEEDRERHPGVLIDTATSSVRVYRAIGIDFWAVIGSPADPSSARHTFLEAMLGLAKAMSEGPARETTLDAVQEKTLQLARAIEAIARSFPRELLPEWAREGLSDDEISWLAAAVSGFFDEGI